MGIWNGLMKVACARLAKDDNRRIASQTPPAGASVAEFAYCDDGDEMHKLNFYRPTDCDGVLPVIVDIHGGAWIYGDKELNKYYCMYLASKGYAVVGMSYRLMPYVGLAEPVQDVFAAMNFLAAHAAEWKCDLQRVMLTGDSAGGHLAAICSCIMQSDKLQDVYGVTAPAMEVKCLVLSHAVCDVHELALDKKGRKMAIAAPLQRKFSQMMFGKHPEKSPIYGYASLSQVAKGLILPPVMVIGCGRDIYLQHTLRLDRFMRERGGEYLYDFVSTEDGPKLGHVYNIMRYEWEQSRRVNDKSLEFFDRCCEK